ncbi:CorA family divalent cation transporter, partial [Kineococcus glutinatus]|uniref:CorA family divalent cation transporter n=1 Tax=Kineococcus glutinatus TaxID=1070872 RepID=UPI0031EFE0EE
MIVDVASYVAGRRQDCADRRDLEGVLRSCRPDAESADPGGFVWLGLKDPTAEEFDRVSGELGLHPLAVEDAVQGRQRPKVERYGDTLFVVVKLLAYDEAESAVETGEAMVFVGERFVVTVRRGEVGSLAPVRHALEGDPQRLRGGPRAVLHAVLEAVVDEYVRIDAALEQDVAEVEEQVFSPARSGDAVDIYSLKREVLEVRRAAVPLASALRE